jgi:hypothetical protein
MDLHIIVKNPSHVLQHVSRIEITNNPQDNYAAVHGVCWVGK